MGEYSDRFGEDSLHNIMKTGDIDPRHNPLEYEFFFLENTFEKGDDVQKLSVIHSLPQLIQLDAISTYNRIIPKIIQELPKGSSEFHIATSRAFCMLADNKLPLNLVTPIIQGLEYKDIIVANSWLETLVYIIPTLTDNQIKRDILPLAMAKATQNKSVFSRVSSCKMLGRMCAHPQSANFDIKKTIVPTVQALCQDFSYEVRAAMCSQLSYVAKGLGEELVKSNLMSNVVELASDENMMVRSISVVTIVSIIPILPRDVKCNTVIPLLKKLCASSIEDGDATYTSIAKELGKILDSLKDDLNEEDCIWFLQFYKTLAQKGFSGKTFQTDFVEPSQGVVCRQQCAFNLPAVTLFTMTKIPNNLNFWYTIFRDLAGDPCYLVRKTVAGCIHEIARILGSQCKLIKQDIVRLLRDDAEEVLQMIVPNLGATLELFSVNGLLSRDTPSHSTLEIGRAVLKCQMELSAGFNWRMQTLFMVQLERLPNCMPSDFIHQHFTPVILTIAAQGRARPVRSQAARTVLMFLRYNMKEIQRKWIRDTLISRLCYSNSCYTRLIYIKMCSHAIELFSSKYFKEFFLIPLTGLFDDPVSNVRLALAGLIPQLKQILGPEDRKAQQIMDNVLSKLESIETNRDVLTVLKTKMKEKPPTGNLNEDRRKEDEENKINEGKFSGIIKTSGVKNPSIIQMSNDGNKPGGPVTRISSAPTTRGAQQRPQVITASDMSFLEQHFYVDAGIILKDYDSTKDPTVLNSNISPETHTDCENYEVQTQVLDGKTSKLNHCIKRQPSWKTVTYKPSDTLKIATVSSENTDIDTLSETEITILEHSTSNVTDDVKVNLRRLKKGSTKRSSNESPIKRDAQIIKRHSSIILPSDIDCSGKRNLNRRSLNITRELSRIPVSVNNSFKNKFSSADVDEENKLILQEVDHELNDNKINATPLARVTEQTEEEKSATCSNSLSTSSMNSSNDPSCSSHKMGKKPPQKPTNTYSIPIINANKNHVLKSSQLPILVKRTQSEVKK